MIVSTTNEVAGYRIVQHLGLVRGLTVRSRSVVGNLVGGIQSVFGGKLSAYVELAEAARQEAFEHMCAHAEQGGANAIVCMRYDATEIMDGVTEVLAYGTAVVVERV
ncbi:MAG: YbjQ family protein [Methylocystis sp.]|uniref:YbjQ family protein n=1 Tax=Methylocystis sp. TaxID=1911079 RepID=UPI003DA4CEF6